MDERVVHRLDAGWRESVTEEQRVDRSAPYRQAQHADSDRREAVGEILGGEQPDLPPALVQLDAEAVEFDLGQPLGPAGGSVFN